MAADGIEVCWVTDKDTTRITHVPSVRVKRPLPPADTPATADGHPPGRPSPQRLTVVDGPAQFEPHWCTDRDRCTYAQDYDQRRVPCPGHSHWLVAPTLPLDAFVRAVCGGQVRVIIAAERLWMRQSRHDGGSVVWTTRPHAAAEAEQRGATEAYERWRGRTGSPGSGERNGPPPTVPSMWRTPRRCSRGRAR